MEEILASIRRIISEDDGPTADAVAEEEEPAAEAEPEPEPIAVPEDEDDGVLELTDKVETLGDLDVYTPAAAEEEPEPDVEAEAFVETAPEPDYTPQPGEGLVGDPAAAAAAAAFGALSSSILMPRDGRTLEDVVRELLRPLLKQWLDTNLPGIVEAQVKAEVERISRGGRVG